MEDIDAVHKCLVAAQRVVDNNKHPGKKASAREVAVAANNLIAAIDDLRVELERLGVIDKVMGNLREDIKVDW